MSLAITGAAQVLRPLDDGLPYLREPRVTLDPLPLLTEGDRIAGFERGGELEIDASGCAVIPGFVDCHTHLPFAGWREREYAQKIAGESYEAIARAGGGIRSSARALASASDEEVLAQARGLAAEMLAHGTTTFECKSGYGLAPEAELRAIRLAASLDVPQSTRSTALLAHAVPDGYDTVTWMEEVARMLPAVLTTGKVTALDIYVESIAFSNDDLRVMGALAHEHGLDLRAHVEQFNYNGSVPVAIDAGARSVDHLACMQDIPQLAQSQTAAVLLPGAEFMGEEQIAPARLLADQGAICVLATDFNPGTSPICSMPVIIGLAVRRYGWSVVEALVGCTLNAAWVLRMSDHLGSIEAGKRADLLVLDGPIERIPYRFGHNPVGIVVLGGEIVHVRPDFAGRVG